METKDFQRTFEDYLADHPDISPEVAKRFKPTFEQLDDEFFAFIMANVVL
ncbi:MAG: hypothetical protein LBN12_06230 [Clostridiales Family XIII bacterium]|jgi:hypothetical protein|nr:hypothetical protein [Clostridiales Family XIII bacterium]